MVCSGRNSIHAYRRWSCAIDFVGPGGKRWFTANLSPCSSPTGTNWSTAALISQLYGPGRRHTPQTVSATCRPIGRSGFLVTDAASQPTIAGRGVAAGFGAGRPCLSVDNVLPKRARTRRIGFAPRLYTVAMASERHRLAPQRTSSGHPASPAKSTPKVQNKTPDARGDGHSHPVRRRVRR